MHLPLLDVIFKMNSNKMDTLKQLHLYDIAFEAYYNEDYKKVRKILNNGLNVNYSNGVFMRIALARNDVKLIKLLYECDVEHPSLHNIFFAFEKDSVNAIKELIYHNYQIKTTHLLIAQSINAHKCEKLVSSILEYKKDLTDKEIIILIEDHLI